MLRRLAEAMRALPLRSPVTQASRIDEASRAWRYARMLAARECSMSAPCSPPSDAVGDLRTGRSSLCHTAVARLTHNFGEATAALVESVRADIGRHELEERAEKRRLELTGTNLAYGNGSGAKEARYAGRSTMPEDERRVTAAADVLGGQAYVGEAMTKRGWELGGGEYDVYAKQRGEASARSRGHNIFPFKTRESLLPLIDALDKKGELGKCAHAGRPGTLKKGQFSLAAFCRLVTHHELVEKEWLEPMPQRPDLTKFQSNLNNLLNRNMKMKNYVKDTITARYPDLFLP